MFTLRVFGGLSLGSSEGQVPVRANQRRRLALLAILAASRRPVGRNKLISLLWPDSDADRARHLLADSIYVIRESLGEDVLLTTGDEVTLNSSRVQSDVTDFMEALEKLDFSRAAASYSGGDPFLEGVHLSDAPEFEHWADATSRQLERQYRDALEKLARSAATRGNYNEAVDWWRKLAANDRSSSRVALELMHALEASGDIAGAIEFAGVHEKIVRTEIDAAPDPSVIAFANELRAKPRPTTQSVTRLAGDRSPQAVTETGEGSEAASSLPLTPPGIAASESRPTQRRSRFLVALGTLSLLLLGYAALRDRTVSGKSAALADRGSSIAVLPLRSVAPGADNEAFADGMTEALIGSISKLSGLRVIASTSAFAFKRHPTDIRLIADSLRVSNVLEGAIQRSGSRIRLSVRLVDARDGSTRWSETYDRDAKDFFAVEDEVGRAVGGNLSLLLSGKSPPRARSRTTIMKAYDFYLRGRHQRELRSDTALKFAIQYFSQAVEADSNFAAAYAGLSEACTNLAFSTNSVEYPRSKLLACSESAASKALKLDDSLSEAHLALGFLRLGQHMDLSASEKELKRALELDPSNRQAHEDLAIVYDATGRADLGIAEARRAEALDPLSVTAIREVGRALYSARRYDEALTELNRARTIGPPVRNVPVIAAQVYAKQRMYSRAISELNHAPPGVFAQALLGHMFGLAGNKQDASRILTALIARFDAGTGSAFAVAVVYAGIHDYDNAFRWLEKSFDDGSIRANIMDPLFDDLRADRRFQAFRPRLGLGKA